MRFVDVITKEQLQMAYKALPNAVALDTETTDKDPRKAKLLCVVLADSKTAYKIPESLLDQDFRNFCFLRTLYLQNFKYDFQVLANHGLSIAGCKFFDTMLLHHLIDENAEHSLDAMVKHYYGDPYKERFWSKYDIFEEATYTDALEYVCKDGIYTHRLAEYFLKELVGKQALVKHVHDLALSLLQTEVRGVDVDLELIHKTKAEMGAEIEAYLPKLRDTFTAECQVWELNKWQEELAKRKTPKGKAGVPKPEFNFGSDKQVSWLLYNELKLPVLKKTKTGAPATDYDVIEKLEESEPRLSTLKAYKGIKNIYATFVEGLLERVEDAKIYPSFNINGTHTGRISHSNPNMGNMPKDGVIRNFFRPPSGMVLIGADYTQLEVVVEANLTKDKNLIRIITEGLSKHDITAQALSVSRDAAKTLNFALQYWCTPQKVAKLLKVSNEEGLRVYKKYWDTYSGVRDLKEECDVKVLQDWEVTNIVGRTRHFQEVSNFWEKERVKRQAYNFLIQGPGGDFMNMAFYRMVERLNNNRHGVGMWTVHDEGIFAVYPQYADEEKQALVDIMCSIGNEYGFEYPLSAKSYGPLERWAKT